MAQLAWHAPGDVDGTSQLPAGHSYPPATWPSKDQLDYTQKAITCLLLVLALPWLVHKLLTRPGDVLSGRGKAALGKGL